MIIFSGCAKYTQQNLEQVALLETGMSKEDVKRIMGNPIRTELDGNQSAWHYCKTGNRGDDFSVLVFKNSKLNKVKSYIVTIRDTDGATGDCKLFTRSYDFTNNAKEIRLKVLPSH